MAPKPRLVDDPNTFIPPAVRRQAKQADELFRAARGEPAAPQEPPPPEQPAPPPPPAQTPLPSEQPSPPPPREPQTIPLMREPAPQETPPPAPQTPPEEESSSDWKRAAKSWETRYKRAENDIIAMSGQLASMQNLIASMQKPVTAETPPELRPQSFLTPEERSEYGEEFLGVVAKKAKEEFSPEIQTLKAQITRLENQYKGNAEQVKAQATLALEAALDAKLPIWRDINIMPEFHAWLALPDLYSGAIKHDLLRAAYAQGNTPRVLSFFKGFLDQEAALVPRELEPRQADDGKVPLETFAAPGRARSSAASAAPVEKPVITRAQISQFYAESAAGKWRGREAEKVRLEEMIFEAEREGRIR
jgi:hypothetical protein